jgi:proton glutamate symport protein
MRYFSGKPGGFALASGRFSKWITIGSLAGLALGLGFGLLVNATRNSFLQVWLHSLEPLAAIWLRALQIIVIPLIVSVLLVSIASTDQSERPGRMGALTLATFVSIFCLGLLLSFAAASTLAGGFHIDQTALASLNPGLGGSPETSAVAPSAWNWLRGLISSRLPTNAGTAYILPLLVGTVLIAVSVRNLEAKRRARFVKFFKSASDATIVVVRWLFYALPVVVFILAGAVYSRAGSLVARGIGYYILAVCGTIFGFTLLQYLIAWFAARISIARFARSLWDAQIAAVTTRSSLASLPPLLDGALNRLGLPRTVAASVLPLSVSTFKASQSIYPLFKLIFLAHIFGISLSPASLLAFVIGVFVLSFTAPGVPSGGSLHTIPLLLALGVPMQGIILFNSVEAIPDIFETLLNVTADMTVAAVVARFLGSGAGVDDARPGPSRAATRL